MSKLLERVLAIKKGEIPPPPVAKLIGLRIVDAKPGEAHFELDADERHTNPMGTLHGGIICDLADAAMGVAFASTCQEDETYATIELKANFLRPVWKARLSARAHVVHRGKNIGLVECDVTDERNRLIAKLSSTMTVLRGEKAKGRGLRV